LRIAKRPEPLKGAPRRFSHGLPIASGIELRHYIGDENAPAQGDAQVVDWLRGQCSANVCMLLKDSVRPMGKADVFFDVGMRLRQDKNQDPSERWPGEAILAARNGKMQIPQSVDYFEEFIEKPRL
jgi:hypothetical protein